MNTMPPQFQLGYCHSPNYFYIPATLQETQYSPASSPPESVISESSQYSNSPSPINPNFNIPSLNPISPYYTPYQEQPQRDQSTYVSRPEPTPRLNKSRITKRPTHSKKVEIAHPYARLYSKEKETKRRKIWNHALEKSIFTPLEISTVSAPQRRKVYIASLEAHVDRLHAQLLELGFWPVAFSELEPFKGLNSKTAKSMVSGLQYDASISNLKLLELERANDDLQKLLSKFPSEC